MTRPGIARVITEPLGGSPLSQALQAGGLSSGISLTQPRDAGEWRQHVDEVRGATGWLTPLEPAFAASGAALDRLRRASAGGVVVTTGQQAALFGGPLYTLSKALTALALADVLEAELGVPTAPVFWAATDDADFLEASVVHVADSDGLQELRLSDAPAAGTIMALASLGDTRTLRARLRRACGSAAHATYLEAAESAFSGDRTIGDAYVTLMRALLEPLGMAVMDSSHAAYREAARPVLVDALAQSGTIAETLADTAARIRASGFEPQVEDERGLSLVFEVRGGVKRRLPVGESAHSTRARSTLAPNVLLRPVVERAILPTAAYVAGPGELAYFAQSNAVASVLGRAPVVGVPRWSGTVLEPFVLRALDRLGVAWDAMKNVHALERRIAQDAMPPAVTAAWTQLREHTDASVRALATNVQASGLMPDAVVEGLRRSLQHKLDRGERRLLAAAKRRRTEARADVAMASAALFPMGKRQERVLNFIPMLARGGDALRDDIRGAAMEHARTLVRASSARPLATR